MQFRHSARHVYSDPLVQALESRRLLSASLTAAYLTAPPGEWTAGVQNHVAISIKNDGDARAVGSLTAGLYASPAPGSAGGDILLATVTRNVNLKPGRGNDLKFQFATPASAPAGTYSLLAKVDSTAMMGLNSSGLILTAPSAVQIQPSSVDLTAERVKGPPEPIYISAGEVRGGPASVLVVNRGNAVARGMVDVKFYLSTVAILDSADVQVGEVVSGFFTLKPGRSETFRARLNPPINTPSGYYYLIAKVTPGGGIVQLNVGDEVGTAARQVQVIRSTPPAFSADVWEDLDTYYAGPVVDCTPGNVGVAVTPTTAPASQPLPCTQSTTAPADVPCPQSPPAQPSPQTPDDSSGAPADPAPADGSATPPPDTTGTDCSQQSPPAGENASSVDSGDQNPPDTTPSDTADNVPATQPASPPADTGTTDPGTDNSANDNASPADANTSDDGADTSGGGDSGSADASPPPDDGCQTEAWSGHRGPKVSPPARPHVALQIQLADVAPPAVTTLALPSRTMGQDHLILEIAP